MVSYESSTTGAGANSRTVSHHRHLQRFGGHEQYDEERAQTWGAATPTPHVIFQEEIGATPPHHKSPSSSATDHLRI